MSGEIAAGDVETAPRIEEGPGIVSLPRRRRGGRWGVLIAVAAALAIVFLAHEDVTWRLQNLRGDGTVTINGQEVATDERAKIADLIAPEARLTVPTGVELDAVLDGVMVVGVAGPADITLPGLPDTDPFVYRVTVHVGEFRLKTGPKFPGREAVLLTTEGRIEITGGSHEREGFLRQ